jgi:hypothetical protein
VKDVLTKGDYSDRIHAGIEFDIKEVFSIRGGLNQGRYWTAGFGLRAWNAILQMATYGENVAHVPGTVRSDRKWVVRYGFEF